MRIRSGKTVTKKQAAKVEMESVKKEKPTNEKNSIPHSKEYR